MRRSGACSINPPTFSSSSLSRYNRIYRCAYRGMIISSAITTTTATIFRERKMPYTRLSLYLHVCAITTPRALANKCICVLIEFVLFISFSQVDYDNSYRSSLCRKQSIYIIQNEPRRLHTLRFESNIVALEHLHSPRELGVTTRYSVVVVEVCPLYRKLSVSVCKKT